MWVQTPILNDNDSPVSQNHTAIESSCVETASQTFFSTTHSYFSVTNIHIITVVLG